MTRILVLSIAAATLAACASPAGRNASAAEIDRLRADCEARGGMLRPTGAATGYEARDNVCVLHSPATPLPDDRRP